jgi:hypothetical protein
MASQFDGYVVHARGRPVSLTKRTDAATVFRALRGFGVPYRQAEETVELLLGVDGGELMRGLRTIESSGTEQDRLSALFALAKHAGLVRTRLAHPDINAQDAVNELPPAVRAWLTACLGQTDFSQGT